MEQLQYQLSVRETKESSTWSYDQKGIMVILLDLKGREGNQENGNNHFPGKVLVKNKQKISVPS